jgi:heptaprenylglyceryl phosphate synthase
MFNEHDNLPINLFLGKGARRISLSSTDYYVMSLVNSSCTDNEFVSGAPNKSLKKLVI